MAAKDYAVRPITRSVSIADANTEYTLDFSDVDAQIKRVEFQCRTAVDVRYAFESGKVGGSVAPYMTLKSGQVFKQDGLMWNKPKIYFGAGSGSLVIEATVWV